MDQLLIDQKIRVIEKTWAGSKIVQYRFNRSDLLALKFYFKVDGSHFHLYRERGELDFDHLGQADSLDELLSRASGLL
jgi:hypothetical protein